MLSRLLFEAVFFLCSLASFAQYQQSLWNFHAPGGSGMISAMLHPLQHASEPYVGAAVTTLPGLDFASGGMACYHQPFPKLQADFQVDVSVLRIGPYQESSLKGLFGRQFGKAVYVYLQPEYRQLAVRAYGRSGELAYAAGLAYRQGKWLLAFYGRHQLSRERISPFLQMAWSYAFSERIKVGLNLKKLPFSVWQSVAALDFTPDKRHSFHLALSGTRGCMLAYERQRGACRLRLGLAYSVNGGLYPENAFHFSW